jgi:ubiquitin-conjugating enzyme E2 M
MKSLFEVGRGRRGQKKQAEDENKVNKKKNPGLLRVQVDLSEIDLPHNVSLHINNKENLQIFSTDVTPDSGLWRGATYNFQFIIPDNYPYQPPKVTCQTKIYHPNIDLQGNVCLNLLKADWRPILTIQQVIHGLIFLFLEPNPDDPLNNEAAKVYRENIAQFKQNVQKSLLGGTVDGTIFQKMKMRVY